MGGVLGRGYHCVMLGLDGSGKTTILNRLKYGHYTSTHPTIGFNFQKVTPGLSPWDGLDFIFQIQSNGSCFHLWDVGGQDKTRPLWRSYIRDTDLILFVLDSSDRLDEAKLELQNLMKLTERSGPPIILIANKQDLPGAASLEEINTFLSSNKTASCQLLSSCGITGEGLESLLNDVKHLVQRRKKIKNSEKSKLLSSKNISHRSFKTLNFS